MNVSLVGIGQGGTSLADAIATRFKAKAFGAINLSQKDLNVANNVADNLRLNLGNGLHDGAGKDRAFSKQCFMDYKDDITKLLNDVLSVEKSDVLFICFSTSGGTGSGLGPAITAYASSSAFTVQGKKNPLVFGIAACADSHEGIRNQQNTIGALLEISKLSDAQLARFLLVNNDIEGTVEDVLKKYTSINGRVADSVYRYFNEFHTSRLGNLDQQDRLNVLKLPGVHSFATFNPADGVTDSPFILPEGARVRGVAGEIPEGSANIIDTIVTSLGIQSDDRTIGFYESTEKAYPIVHFGGFSNLKKVTERYQNTVSQIQARSTQADKNDKTIGAGFTRVTENNSWMEDQYATKKAGSAEDIFSLLQ